MSTPAALRAAPPSGSPPGSCWPAPSLFCNESSEGRTEQMTWGGGGLSIPAVSLSCGSHWEGKPGQGWTPRLPVRPQVLGEADAFPLPGEADALLGGTRGACFRASLVAARWVDKPPFTLGSVPLTEPRCARSAPASLPATLSASGPGCAVLRTRPVTPDSLELFQAPPGGTCLCWTQTTTGTLRTSTWPTP